MPPSHVVRQLRPIGVCGKKKVFAPRPLTAMVDANGDPIESPEALDNLWFQHFAAMEDGVETDGTQLLTMCEEQQCARTTVVPELHQVPTLLDIEGAFRANKYGKASYHDDVPSDLCHRYPQVLARSYHHLALKQSLCVREPITYKGGVLVHAFKGRGSAAVCDNYRALMVTSVLAKTMHSILRRDCLDVFEHYRLPLQLGGLPGRSVSQGSQTLLCYAHYCRENQRSLGVLFVDIRQAFYRLFREHIVANDDPDATVVRLFQTYRSTPRMFPTICCRTSWSYGYGGG